MSDFHHKLPHSRRQSGFTLVEMIVALVLGLLLTGGMLEIFMGSKRVYRVQEGLSRLQENGRFAVEFIARDLRMAGFMGCSSALSEDKLVNTLNDGNDFLYDFSTAVQGFEAASSSTWAPALDSTITDLTIPPTGGTDVLSLRKVVGDLPVTAPFMPTTSAALQTVAGNSLQQSDIIVVADCEASAVLQICGDNPSSSGTIVHNEGTACGSPGNATKNLGKVFRDDARILLPVVETLYSAPGDSGRPALWRLNNSQPLGSDNPQELIEGVEDMQALYGEDTDDDETADIFVAANAVSDWADVVSVRISLLLQTLEDNLSLEAQQYFYNGATVTAGDRRLRRVFTTTVSLRNRIP